jgi:hypothetical protein
MWKFMYLKLVKRHQIRLAPILGLLSTGRRRPKTPVTGYSAASQGTAKRRDAAYSGPAIPHWFEQKSYPRSENSVWAVRLPL